MKKLILPILTLFLIFSCNNDDDSTNTDVMTFSLVRDLYSPELGLSNFYESNQVLWTFDFTNTTITITTQQGIESPVLSAGSYNYTLIDSECNFGENRSVLINELNYGVLILDELQEGRIRLTNECVDGNALYFEN